MKKIMISTIFLILLIACLGGMVNAKQSTTKLYLDTPRNLEKVNDKIFVEGWVMSLEETIDLQIWVDGQKRETKITRYERPDVIQAISGYGGIQKNPKPGFRAEIDVNDKVDGKNHALMVKAYSKDNELLEVINKTVLISNYEAKIYMDSPRNQKEFNAHSIIQGWILTNDENATMKAFLDEKECEITSEKRKQRTDVVKSVLGYGGVAYNPTPGFEITLNIKDVTDGNHSLKMQIYSKEGKLLAEHKRNVKVQKYIAKTYLEQPRNKEVLNVQSTIKAWAIQNDTNTTTKIYIDDQEQTMQNVKKFSRVDVLKSFPQYGGVDLNPTPGMEFTLNLENIEDGNHTLTIKTYAKQGNVLAEHKREIMVQKYETNAYIDSPKYNMTGTKIPFSGWMLSADKDATIKVYVDEQEQKDLVIQRLQRADVLKSVHGFGGIKSNPTPGFSGVLDVSQLRDGKHQIKIDIFSKTGKLLYTVARDFQLTKYKTKIEIDEPKNYYYEEKQQIQIRGWVMSELADKKVVIQFDGKEIENVSSEKRPDVLEKIKDYGGTKTNTVPGYQVKIDLSSYAKGEHTITILAVSKENNEILKQVTRKIKIVEPIQYKSGVYGKTGALVQGRSGGSEMTYLQYGHGPNVLFATFCVHGYEDLWDRDGTVLVDTANQFYQRLLSDKDYELAEKWTIYIFPEINADGRRIGWTKNGPGRTTVYSQTGKGIDINRSWQVGSTYKRYTDNRNYNGTQGFQAYEAAYLRDFLLSHKAKNGKTVLVDLHGWEEQLIGDESICRFYKQQYTECATHNYGKYGTQYLISWAREALGAKVSLVELPVVSNATEVKQRNLSGKYVEATLNMLRNQ